MEKKKYSAPSTKVVIMQQRSRLLNGSDTLMIFDGTTNQQI